MKATDIYIQYMIENRYKPSFRLHVGKAMQDNIPPSSININSIAEETDPSKIEKQNKKKKTIIKFIVLFISSTYYHTKVE